MNLELKDKQKEIMRHALKTCKMQLSDRTEKELFRELAELYVRVGKLEKSEAECKRAEKRLQQQAEFLNLVLESLPHPFYVIDAFDYTIRIANSATHVGQLSKGVTCHALTHKSDKPCASQEHPCPLQIVRETKKPITVEHIHYDKEGKPINVEVHAYPVLDSEGNVNQIIESCVDITERKRAEQELRESREQLRDLYAHLQAVREQERAIVARDIHDDLGQTLAALKMDLCWLEQNLPRDKEALIQKTKSITKLVDMTVQSVRRIYSGLRPFLLDELGLVAAIESMGQGFQKHTGIKCDLTFSPPGIVVDKELATTLFRIFQETLSNVSRHANATRVKVNLREKAGVVTLTVSDNGKGIAEEQISHPKSFGLMGIQERAHVIGGEVKISGIENEGTTVTVSVPARE